VTKVQEALSSLKTALTKVFEARGAVVETFHDVAEELDGEKVSRKQKIIKVCGRVASIAGTSQHQKQTSLFPYLSTDNTVEPISNRQVDWQAKTS
jgi:hypothetical protein